MNFKVTALLVLIVCGVLYWEHRPRATVEQVAGDTTPKKTQPEYETGRLDANVPPTLDPLSLPTAITNAPSGVAERKVAPAKPSLPAKPADTGPSDGVDATAIAARSGDILLARAALGAVGLDADADLIWAATINDPTIPPQARKDLIEDLNEDGFPDPEDITADDLPLILSRIEIIEQLGPYAMDEVNAAAFQEAYKDLLKMYEKAVGR